MYRINSSIYSLSFGQIFTLVKLISVLVVPFALLFATQTKAGVDDCQQIDRNANVPTAIRNDLNSSVLTATGTTQPIGLQVIESSSGGAATLKFTHENPCLKDDKEVKSYPLSITLSIPTAKNADISRTLVNGSLTTDQSSIKLEYGHTSVESTTESFTSQLDGSAAYKQWRIAQIKYIVRRILTKDNTAALSIAELSQLRNERRAQDESLESIKKQSAKTRIESLEQDAAKHDLTHAEMTANEILSNYISRHPYDDEAMQFNNELKGKVASRIGTYAEQQVINNNLAINEKLWGFTGTYRYQQLGDVVESAGKGGLAKVNKYPWSAGIYYGTTFKQHSAMPVFTTLTVKYDQSFKAGDPVTLCPLPNADDSVVSCNSGLGGPRKSEGLAYAVDFRKAANAELWLGQYSGWSATLSYKQTSRKGGIDIPFYFTPAKGGGDSKSSEASYGLDLGWQNDNSAKFYIAIFVGGKFTPSGGAQ